MTEIALMIDDDTQKRRPPMGGRNMSHAEVLEEVARKRRRTLTQRIAEAREN